MWEPTTWYCTCMLWSIDSCQNKYLLASITWPYCGLKCWPIEVTCFKLSVDKVLECLELVAGSTLSGFLCDWLQVFCWSKFINRSSAFILGWIYISTACTLLKSPWKSNVVLEKPLNFYATPLKVLEISSPLNILVLKVFLNAIWLSKRECES